MPGILDQYCEVQISLRIEPVDDEIVVTDNRYHIQASGPTKELALENFWRVFYGYEDLLAGQEGEMSDQLKGQLAYIRTVKAWEARLQEAKETREKARIDRLVKEGMPIEDAKL